MVSLILVVLCHSPHASFHARSQQTSLCFVLLSFFGRMKVVDICVAVLFTFRYSSFLYCEKAEVMENCWWV